MNVKLVLLAIALLTCSTAYADMIAVHLNQSAETYSLIGQGGSDGYGTYLAQQGTCSVDASTTCSLTGTYTGSTPGFTLGTYTILTTYANSEGGLAATSTTRVADDGGNFFLINTFAPDVIMTAFLIDSESGLHTIPVVLDGVGTGNFFSIAAVNSACAGLSGGTPCTQGNVGLVLGASISSAVTGNLFFDSDLAQSNAALTPPPALLSAEAPEPGWLAFGGLIPGVYALARRRFGTRG